LSIQQDQERHKTMMNFARIQFFIERFAQFDEACKALELGDPEPLELSPYIWGPPHYIIQVQPLFLDPLRILASESSD
jgi:hypothetical protein